jgi:hypothetical protein
MKICLLVLEMLHTGIQMGKHGLANGCLFVTSVVNAPK